MSNNYRVKYKKGDFEVEVESDNKAYVDSKLSELLEMQFHPGSSGKEPKKRQQKKHTGETDAGESQKIDILGLVEAIHEADNFKEVEKHILKKPGQLGRAMMCLYFAKDHLDSPYLTTGQIEKITDECGVKIDIANVSKTIKANRKYFSTDRVRKAGAIVKYKLNKKGIEAFEKLLTGDKLE